MSKNLSEKLISFDQVFITEENVNCLDENGDAILIIAAKEGNIEYIREILQLKVNINIKNSAGSTALIEAVLSNKIEVVRLLLDHGAITSIKDYHENTAFTYAYSMGYNDIASIVIPYDDDSVSDEIPILGIFYFSWCWGCC